MHTALNGASGSLVKEIEDMLEDPSVAWTALIQQYEPSTTEVYMQLMQDIKKCVLEDARDDPEMLMQSLTKFNTDCSQKEQVTFAMMFK